MCAQNLQDVEHVDEPFENEFALFEGDQGTFPADLRRVLTLLIRDTCVCALNSPTDFETIRQHQRELTRQLNNLGLDLTVSTRYEVAYAQQVTSDDLGALVLKKSQPLSRDASILLASIRVLQHNDEANGEENWFVSKEDLSSLLASGPYAVQLDDSRRDCGLKRALKQLTEAGYLNETPSAPERYRVMPLLPAVFTLERAKELLEAYMQTLPQYEEEQS